MIQYDDFVKVELRTAEILEAEAVPDTDKLVKLKVRVGEEQRQIVAGIKKHYQPENLVGKTIVVVMNLEPRTLKGLESHGMLLAATDSDGNLSLLTVDKAIVSGSKVG